MTEPLSLERFIVFPIQHDAIWNMYQKALELFWVPKEIDFKQDRADFESMKQNEQRMLKHVLAFFAASDSIVNENIISRFINEVPFPESRQFYAFQTAIEAIHSEVYGMTIEEIVPDKQEQNKLFRAILGMEGVKKKSTWAIDYMEAKDKPFAERLVAFVIVEGVFFQAAFAIIFWFRDRYPGKLPGLIHSNQLISRDERLHTDHGVLVYNSLKKEYRLKEEKVHAIFKSAMEVERFFVGEFLGDGLGEGGGVLGLNFNKMIQYVEFVCDLWLVELGYSKLFHAKNPLDYMERISLAPRTNFFELRNGEYRRGKSVDSTIQATSFKCTDLDV